MTEPTLTVAVAACGRVDSLETCLAALAAGTRRPAQIIVVDQDASDAARACVERLGSIPHAYLPQERLGLSASRNLALELTTSDFLAVTDDDCVPAPDWVEQICVTLAEPKPPDVVTGSVLPTRQPGPGEFMVSQRARPERIDHDRRRPPWRIGTGGNFIASTAVLRQVGGWDERLGTGSPGRAAEDIELIDRLMRAPSAIRYEPAVVVRHELQNLEQRLSTRWTYAYGIGAFLALRLCARDRYVGAMLFDYVRMHGVSLVNALIRLDRLHIRQHGRALLGLVPGVWYGVRVVRRPARRAVTMSTVEP